MKPEIRAELIEIIIEVAQAARKEGIDLPYGSQEKLETLHDDDLDRIFAEILHYVKGATYS
ncbi:MAG: hypothetical protein LBT32_03675 [Peptococcaceae bacterium]|jgi:hypothetical protein|nr:hypothetical protein [Peptococcaceae bacterium]